MHASTLPNVSVIDYFKLTFFPVQYPWPPVFLLIQNHIKLILICGEYACEHDCGKQRFNKNIKIQSLRLTLLTILNKD